MRANAVPPFAWITVALADLIMAAWGSLVVIAPDSMTPGYESFTATRWSEVSGTTTGEYLLLVYRLVGAFNVVAGAAGLLLAVLPFRRGERWAWWGVLVVNAIAYPAPIVYDAVVGYHGMAEWIEIGALAGIAVAVAISLPRGAIRIASSASPRAAAGRRA